MPYKSKAERERENWMTPPQAVNQISSSNNCSADAARKQILTALADGALRPLRWEPELDERPRDMPLPPFGRSAAPAEDDTPPSGRFWLDAEIDWESGKVRDDWSIARVRAFTRRRLNAPLHKRREWRVLLLHRHRINLHWPSVAPHVASAVSRKHATSGRKPGPQPKKNQAMMGQMQADIKTARLTKDQLRDMADKELLARYGDSVGAKRTACRTARDRTLSEFDANRNSGE